MSSHLCIWDDCDVDVGDPEIFLCAEHEEEAAKATADELRDLTRLARRIQHEESIRRVFPFLGGRE
ncbi:MAG: hypothetical protein KY455_10110 [Euryarchaeota archaeon]|nr:hypothetical protein [Euryarchaeota archaeon]